MQPGSGQAVECFVLITPEQQGRPALLQIPAQLATNEHDPGSRLASGPMSDALGRVGPGERRAVGIRRVDCRNH